MEKYCHTCGIRTPHEGVNISNFRDAVYCDICGVVKLEAAVPESADHFSEKRKEVIVRHAQEQDVFFASLNSAAGKFAKARKNNVPSS